VTGSGLSSDRSGLSCDMFGLNCDRFGVSRVRSRLVVIGSGKFVSGLE
jgi:site-specific DNA-cytosine methylase